MARMLMYVSVASSATPISARVSMSAWFIRSSFCVGRVSRGLCNLGGCCPLTARARLRARSTVKLGSLWARLTVRGRGVDLSERAGRTTLADGVGRDCSKPDGAAPGNTVRVTQWGAPAWARAGVRKLLPAADSLL